MRVKYGNEVDTQVPDDSDPQEILNILKESYAELSNAEYSFSTEDGERVMTLRLKSGNKA